MTVLLGREDIADGGLTVSSSLKKRFTFAFLSIEEDFGRERVLIWRVEHHSTQDIAGRRAGGYFLAEKRFPFSFLSIEEDFGKGENSNLEGGASFHTRHRGTADWRLLSRGKALYLRFSFY